MRHHYLHIHLQVKSLNSDTSQRMKNVKQVYIFGVYGTVITYVQVDLHVMI